MNEAAPQFTYRPTIEKNPNPRAPLAAILRFSTDQQVKTMVQLHDGKRRRQIEFDESINPSEGLPILGMHPGRKHEIEVSIQDIRGKNATYPERLSYTTPDLPTDAAEFPPIKVIHRDEKRLEPGVMLLSVRRRAYGRIRWITKKQWPFILNWGMILALDTEGEVVWYYLHDSRIAGIQVLRNGNILMHSDTTGFVATEIDLLGNTIHEWYAARRPQGEKKGAIPVDVQTMHHQPTELPSGNFLSFSANARQIENWYSSEYDSMAPRKNATVMGDTIIEFTREGEIVWRWNAFDHLDINRIGYNTFSPYWQARGFPEHWDWTHGNGLCYDPKDNSIIASFFNQDALIKIDRATREIRWILGDPTGWSDVLAGKVLKPVGDIRLPYHPHNPRLTKEGTLILMDNGIFQARPFNPPVPPDKTFSRAVEYEINEQDMTVQEAWASAKELKEDSINDWAMGDAHRLPKTNNILAIYALCVPRLPNLTFNEYDETRRHVDDMPMGALIRQYSRTVLPEVLLEVEISHPFDLMQWEVYGGLHLSNLYDRGDAGSRQHILTDSSFISGC